MDQNNNPEDKKTKKDKKNKKNVVIDDPDEVQKLLEELSKDNPELKKLIEDISDNSDIKTIKIFKTETTVKSKIFSIILTIIMNIVFGLGLSGLIVWINSDAINLLIFFLLYSLIEILLQYLISTFIPKLKIFLFGLGNFICSIIGFVLSIVLLSSVEIKDIFLTIVLFIILNIIKAIIRFTVNKYRVEKGMKK